MEHITTDIGQTGSPTLSAMPRQHAVLLDGMSKTSLLNLIEEAGHLFGLNHTDVCVLRRIAMKTSASDYTDPFLSPICYEKQFIMAESVLLTTDHFRRVERKLEKLGFIERNTWENGYRGKSQRSNVAAGLSLEPLIARAAEITEALELWRHEDECKADLRNELRITRRQATYYADLCPADYPAVCDFIGAKEKWRSPRHYKDISALSHAIENLKVILSRLIEISKKAVKMSGAPDINVCCHIHNTTNNNKVISIRKDKGTASLLAEDNYLNTEPPNGGSDAMKKKNEKDVRSVNSEFIANLSVSQILGFGSEELNFYASVYSDQDEGDMPPALALDKAITMRNRELGINPTAYEQAIEVMGHKQAMIACVIIDTNTKHPLYPIKQPGGALRAFIKKYNAGELNLAASINGIWAREHKSDQDEIN